MEVSKKVTAVEILSAFNEFVESNPENRLRKKLSYPKRKKMLKPLEGLAWDEVENRKEEIDNWLRQYGSSREIELSDKTILFSWHWLARAYEYGVIKAMITRNPFKHILPESKTGSYID